MVRHQQDRGLRDEKTLDQTLELPIFGKAQEWRQRFKSLECGHSSHVQKFADWAQRSLAAVQHRPVDPPGPSPAKQKGEFSAPANRNAEVQGSRPSPSKQRIFVGTKGTLESSHVLTVKIL